MAVTIRALERRIDQALRRSAADLVIKNARLLDVASGELIRGDIAICDDRIVGTLDDYRGILEIDGREMVAVPGFIDTHVHVESALVTPFEFDRTVLPHGTTTAICDPHEIANVLGIEGLQYFLDSTETLAMDLRVQLSSCVPSTQLETSGARLTAGDLAALREHPAVIGLAEMMNVRGVLDRDPEVLEKIAAFESTHIDGHCPLVRGYELNAYCACGIKNCHESTTLEEATEKLRKGQQVLIREGSRLQGRRSLDPDSQRAHLAVHRVLHGRPQPARHRRAGPHRSFDPASDRTRSAGGCRVPGGLVVGGARLRPRRSRRDRTGVSGRHRAARRFRELLRKRRHLRGRPVDASSFEGRAEPAAVGDRSIRLDPVTEESLRGAARTDPASPVIGVTPGSIVTEHLTLELPFRDGRCFADTERGVQKLCVLERHGRNHNVGRGFVRGFGLREGALASSVAHDSHNVITIGANDATWRSQSTG